MHTARFSQFQCMLVSQLPPRACWEANPPFPVHAGKPTPLPSECWEANLPFPGACWEASPPREQNDTQV